MAQALLKWPAQAAPDRQDDFLHHISPEHRALVERRLTLIHLWREAVSNRAPGISERMITSAILALAVTDGIRISRSTLYRWGDNYNIDGIFGLVDPRWLTPPSECCFAFLAELARLFRAGESMEITHAKARKFAAMHNHPRCTIAESRGWIRHHLLPATGTERGHSTPV